MNNEVPLRVALLLMQKNEGELLRSWAVYHAALFGMNNLFIWDNGSDDAQTLEILSELDSRGANVDMTTSDPYDFNRKGVILRNKIRSLDAQTPYDFYFPTDCDEFLVVEKAGLVTCDPNIIFQELRPFLNSEAPLSIDAAYYNLIGKPGLYWRKWHKKTFFAKGTVKELDHGYHEGTTIKGSARVSTSFVHMHFHYRPYDRHIEHSKEKIKSQVDVNDEVALAKMAENRLVKVILEDKDTYLRRFDDAGAVRVPEFSERFKSLGIQLPYSDTD